MIKASEIHKEQVTDILSECFEQNKTVNWIVKQDDRRKERIMHLLNYSFDVCVASGQIYLNDDATAAAICQVSYHKIPVLEEISLTLKFIFNISGIAGIGKVLRREKYIKQHHPAGEDFIYLWFIGVRKSQQGNGIGAALLKNIIETSNKAGLPIYVETSVEKNIRFYERHGFREYHVSPEAMFGFKLYFLRRLPGK